MFRGFVYSIAVILSLGTTVSFSCASAFAQHPASSAPGAPQGSAAPATRQQLEAEAEAAFKAAHDAAIGGPAEIKLIDQGKIDLPEGLIFIPQAPAARLLRAFGNWLPGAGPIGIITSPKDEYRWMIVVRFINEGYIKDDDAKNWNADELLSGLKEESVQGNADRSRRGFPEIEIIGWVEPPAYDVASHRLVWSLASRQKDAPPNRDNSVNYNTYALGREGYFSLNLLTSQGRVANDKSIAHSMLSALSYNDGKRYDQFNSVTDKVAAYGLAALVGGVAAKKVGLFALLLAFGAKFAKLIAIAGGVLLAGLIRLFGPSKKTPEA